MALKDTDVTKYQKMSTAELQAKAAEVQQLRERPKAAVGFGSRVGTFIKTLGLAAIGAVIGHWVGNKAGSMLTKNGAAPNKVAGWLLNNKRLVGAAGVTAIGVASMRGIRREEVEQMADLELAKIQAVLQERERAQQPQITAQDMAALNSAMQNGQAVGQHTQQALSGRSGMQQQAAR